MICFLNLEIRFRTVFLLVVSAVFRFLQVTNQFSSREIARCLGSSSIQSIEALISFAEYGNFLWVIPLGQR